jgi:5,10-methylenetetrahydrofolate reductase
MKTEKMVEFVEAMIEKAATTTNSNDAVTFAQAAREAAHAISMCVHAEHQERQ